MFKKLFLFLTLIIIAALSGCSPASLDTADSSLGSYGENQISGQSSLLISGNASNNTANVQQKELRGVWISYMELKTIFGSEETFQSNINAMFDNAKSLKLNAVFVHVRPFSDAFYPSKYFPWSELITGTQGVSPGYDPLAYMIKAAHERGLEFHAWINPYRISNKSNDPSLLCDTNPARIWMTDNDRSNDDWAVKAADGIYYNPAIVEVQRLIIDGIKEIVNNYEVDGIHFDDYFYPVTGESFDRAAYGRYKESVSGTALSLSDWRRTNVNAMINGVYRVIKAKNSKIQFGISPMADIDTDYSEYYADVKAWSDAGYVDYLIPQLYFGFEYPSENFCFDALAENWTKNINIKKTDLYFGLASYKIGTDQKADAAEWNKYDDILKRQVEYIRKAGKVSGFVFYSYSSLFDSKELCAQQLKNLKSII